jgi:DNA-directed RNA polymerase subunit RPC12/RpoP
VRIRLYCPDCLARVELDAARPAEGACAKCARFWSFVPSETELRENRVDRCGSCGHRAFFVQRDFDQRIGCLILAASLAAALFVGWRFGWIYFTPVLLATVLIDWILAFRIGPVTICYRCDAEYRDVASNSRHRPYDPHVAERFARVRTVRRMRE